MILGCLNNLTTSPITNTGHFVPKPGQSTDDFWKDRMECERYDSASGLKLLTPWLAGGPGGKALRHSFNSCMKAKGYEWEEYATNEGK